jgi:hypothetical protein
MGQPNRLAVVLHIIRNVSWHQWHVLGTPPRLLLVDFLEVLFASQKVKSQSKEIGTRSCFGVKAYFPQDKTQAPLSLLSVSMQMVSWNILPIATGYEGMDLLFLLLYFSCPLD